MVWNYCPGMYGLLSLLYEPETWYRHPHEMTQAHPAITEPRIKSPIWIGHCDRRQCHLYTMQSEWSTEPQALKTGRRALISTESNHTDPQDTPNANHRQTPRLVPKSSTHLVPLTYNHLGTSAVCLCPLEIIPGVQTAPSPRITLGETIPLLWRQKKRGGGVESRDKNHTLNRFSPDRREPKRPPTSVNCFEV